MSAVETKFIVEAFEVSALNGDVMSTRGRLRRRFPASGVSLPRRLLQEPSFCESMASTITKMSRQRAKDTKPKAKKAAKNHDEERDTTDPKLVTELLMSILKPLGDPVSTTAIWKNTRDDVLYSSSLLPWRRSPMWLVIRVQLQLKMGSGNDNIYKQYMIYNMACILDKAICHGQHPDTLWVMSAKIHQRLRKLGTATGPICDFVHATLRKTATMLENKWREMQTLNSPKLPLSRLTHLYFDQDTKVSIPYLDQFIADINTRSSDQSQANFTPDFNVSKYSFDQLPSVPDRQGDHPRFGLMAFEAWVAAHLTAWIEANEQSTDACGDLRATIEKYHRLASNLYKSNPEAISLMILTILELWIGCDKIAVLSCPLLKEYDPEIPGELLQNLVLCKKEQMHRLQLVEDYISQRAKQSRHWSWEVFGAFGGRDSFSNAYFRTSTAHQRLKGDIEAWATQLREAKRQEFRKQKDLYNDLMSKYEASTCQTRTNWSDWERRFYTDHSPDCCKCGYLRRADALSINIHEWPLPHSSLEAESTVFELTVPATFGHWRDVTVFLRSNVLGCSYSSTETPRSSHSLNSYNGLSRFFVSFGHGQRIIALSENKPHEVTHRRNKPVGTVTEEDVCLRNGLFYRYFDQTTHSFVQRIDHGDLLEKQCTYKLPQESSALQQFLMRGPEKPSGPPPNLVIASQSDCPDELTLEEYKALCSLPLGYRIQWQNILIQLRATTINFNTPEAALVILQCMNQVGPRGDQGPLREAHTIIEESRIAGALLTGLDEMLVRIQRNWQAWYTLSTLISLACRLHTLITCDQGRRECVQFLERAREVGLGWMEELQGSLHRSVVEEERAKFSEKIFDIALVCASSFYLDNIALSDVLSSCKDATNFFQCSLIICEKEKYAKFSALVHVLHERWQRLSYQASDIMIRRVVDRQCPSLDKMIRHNWSAYRASSTWKSVSKSHDFWLENKTSSKEGGGLLEVHFNLLNGDLLVNGVPLSRLPNEYECRDMYQILFGKAAIEIMPSAVSGMRFSSKKTFADFALHFGISDESDLLIRAERNDLSLELIPRRLLRQHFPTAFVEDHVHWYDSKDDKILFVQQKHPWDLSLAHWTLKRSASESSNWYLVLGEQTLISLQSETVNTMADIFQSLEEPLHMHCIYDKAASVMEINLPRLQLMFRVAKGCDKVRSRENRGMIVDESQEIGSLVGLGSKLILRAEDSTTTRIVIVPYGSVKHTQSGHHVCVGVDKNSVSKTYSYGIDNRLGRLIARGDLSSMLWLCYMHALTSFCLPNPLTGRTGTEDALSILESAAVKSYTRIDQRASSILQSIADLSPTRSYYPAHERVMQVVEWSPSLSFLSQHGKFQAAAQDLLDRYDRYKLFAPQCDEAVPVLKKGSSGLALRDAIRSSTYRTAGFGAERFTVDFDRVYSGRDQWKESPASLRVVAMASSVLSKSRSPDDSITSNLPNLVWQYLAQGSPLNNTGVSVNTSELVYDAKWLLSSQDYIAENFVNLHCTFLEMTLNKFNIIMWFSSLAYSSSANIPILSILSALFSDSSIAQKSFPPRRIFQISKGVKLDKTVISHAVKDASEGFNGSPDAKIPREPQEPGPRWKQRQQSSFSRNQKAALQKLVNDLTAQWPCDHLDSSLVIIGSAAWSVYFHTTSAVAIAEPILKSWYDNGLLRKYIEKIAEDLPTPHTITCRQGLSLNARSWDNSHSPRFVGINDLFSVPAPLPSEVNSPDLTWLVLKAERPEDNHASLADLIANLGCAASSEYEASYVDGLSQSRSLLGAFNKPSSLQKGIQEIKSILSVQKTHFETQLEETYSAILEAMGKSRARLRGELHHWPRLSPTLILRQLSRDAWGKLSSEWKDCIVNYGLTLCYLQQTERRLLCCDNPAALMKELENTGRANWRPEQHPEYLLMEIEANITIRKVQQDVAEHMSGHEGSNGVMQLNMGEGKSSVIVPMVVTSLADKRKLVRIIVGKPQAKQMSDMLIAKLGGLVDRPVFYMPFSRVTNPGRAEVAIIRQMLDICTEEGGVLLLQPEHILSLKLMAIDRVIAGEDVGPDLVSLVDFMNNTTRDVVDESDENFSVKFELVYTQGLQQPVDQSPFRWTCVQDLLGVLRRIIFSMKEELFDAIEVIDLHSGGFPRTRVLQESAQTTILHTLATTMCNESLGGLQLSAQPSAVKAAIYTYITKTDLTADEVEEVEKSSFWTDSTSSAVLLIRGLIAQGILSFVFMQKRWRVDYGLVNDRVPPTSLAVPYRAKDSPSLRSEFSHPDVVVLLTTLSYYYGGLSDDHLLTAFHRLYRSDQADLEYQAWVQDAPNLPESFRQLTGVNLEDMIQCKRDLFPCLRYAKGVVDFFLAHVVFPKQLREFPHKLSASGWDIGETKIHRTTGFSGTNDSRFVLPLSVKQLDLPAQAHTNALVLNYLLGSENTVITLGRDQGQARPGGLNGAEELLSTVMGVQPPVRVILDVGAQNLEFTNLELARKWLGMHPDHENTMAAVFFDENDHICVVDRYNKVEMLDTSPYFGQLGSCLIFLDEVHTRGTDLKLPQSYRAAVTLGANLVKDKLVQGESVFGIVSFPSASQIGANMFVIACMRMRELGKGQSVVFCMPREIGVKVQACSGRSCISDVTVADILQWSILESWREASHSIPIWAIQGRRHYAQQLLWKQAGGEKGLYLSKEIAIQFLENEAESIEQKYRPDGQAEGVQPDLKGGLDDSIGQRCREFGSIDRKTATLREEQERELSPEIERERQVQRAPPAKPAPHQVHPDVRQFVQTGSLLETSPAFVPAFKSLADTSAAGYLDVSKYTGRLLVTKDFSRCIQVSNKGSLSFTSDCFQRSVQWILTNARKSPREGDQQVVIVSPYEAQELLPIIKKSEHVSIHLYAARPNLGYRPLDHLDLFTIPDVVIPDFSSELIIELNLFSGQLCFGSLKECIFVCNMLAVSRGCNHSAQSLGQSYFQESPIKFFSTFFTKIRRHCESIDKTHMGLILDGKTLTVHDFEQQD